MPLDTQSKIDLINTDPKLVTGIMAGPSPQDDFIGGVTLGADYSKYLQMRRDPHVRSVLQRRRQSILSRRVVVEYPKGGKGKSKTLEAYQTALRVIRYEALCSALLNSGQLIGFAVLQLDWQKEEEGEIVPAWRFVPQDRFVFAWHEPNDQTIPCCDGAALDPRTEIVLVQGYELRLLTKANPFKGERCPKNRFLVYTFDADESPWGLGLGYSIYPWYVVKRESMKAWLLHSDRLGSPPILGSTPENIDENDSEYATLLRKFEDFLRAVSPNAWARLPEGFEAKVMDLVGAVGPEVHEKLIKTANDEISKVVLGEVPFSDKATGSYAANISQVEDREASLIDADVNILDDPCQDQLWIPFGAFNHPAQPVPIVRRETRADDREQESKKLEQEQKKARIDQDKTMQELGYRVKPDMVAEVYGQEYVDASSIQQSDSEEQPQALAAVLGPRTDTLLQFLQQIGSNGYPRENAIAVVVNVFGIPKSVAQALVPETEQPTPGVDAPQNLDAMLGDALGEGNPSEEISSDTELEDGDDDRMSVEEFRETLEAIYNGNFYFYDFAAKKKTSGKKNCTPGKSHFCQKEGGAGTCLPMSKNCKYKPSGDVATVDDYVKQKVGGKKGKPQSKTEKQKQPPDSDPNQNQSSDFPDLQTAKKNYKLLGSGISGEVYLDDKSDPKRAIKYLSMETAFSDDELEGVKRAGDLGVAPKVLGVSADKKAYAMEYLNGYQIGIPDDDDDRPYLRSMLTGIRQAHDKGYIIGDLHEDNVMFSSATKEARFVDQSFAAKGDSWKERADQMLNKQSWRPLAADVVGGFIKESGDKSAARRLKQLQKKFQEGENGIYDSKTKTLKPVNYTEADYEQMTKDLYSILDPLLR